ncbi:hypothetical protein [Paeniglutamicibacter sp. NPDC091659]|uniref:hypothetical protein n=1 Tax=Paeniglutamicibacter sp. NPDC091659 TaxID=3364389 RepID=UPI0037FBE727
MVERELPSTQDRQQGRKPQRPLGDDYCEKHGQGGKPDKDTGVRQGSAATHVRSGGENQNNDAHHGGTEHAHMPILHCRP